MDARELRIGSIIQLRHHTMGWSEPQPCEAWMIADAEKYPDSYRFVPLTEDRLIRMGFERATSLWDNIIAHYVKDNFQLDAYDNYYSFLGVKIKYVHKLQNLYFDFKNEELEIKE